MPARSEVQVGVVRSRAARCSWSALHYQLRQELIDEPGDDGGGGDRGDLPFGFGLRAAEQQAAADKLRLEREAAAADHRAAQLRAQTEN